MNILAILLLMLLLIMQINMNINYLFYYVWIILMDILYIMLDILSIMLKYGDIEILMLLYQFDQMVLYLDKLIMLIMEIPHKS